MKNKKIKLVILLFFLMIVVVVAGFFVIRSDIERGKINVLVAQEDISKDYTVTVDDQAKFKLESREKSQIGDNYYTSWEQFLNEAVANNYIVNSNIFAGNVITKKYFINANNNTQDGNIFDGLTNPTVVPLNVENLTYVDGLLNKNEIVKVYATIETEEEVWMGILVDKVYVYTAEYEVDEPDKLKKLEVAISANDVHKITAPNVNTNIRLYFFKMSENGGIDDKKLSEVMFEITKMYDGLQIKGFNATSDDLEKILSNPQRPNLVNLTFFENVANLTWRGIDLIDVYVRHYNLLDGSRGKNYGRYTVGLGNVEYSNILDEYSVSFKDEGYYEIDFTVRNENVNDEGETEVTNTTNTYKFIVETENTLDEFKFTNDEYRIVLSKDYTSLAEGIEIPEITFIKDYFKNVSQLKNATISLEQFEYNFGKFDTYLYMENGAIQMSYKDFLTSGNTNDIKVTSTTLNKLVDLFKKYAVAETDKKVLGGDDYIKKIISRLEVAKENQVSSLYNYLYSFVEDDNGTIDRNAENLSVEASQMKSIFLKLYLFKVLNVNLCDFDKKEIGVYFYNCSIDEEGNKLLDNYLEYFKEGETENPVVRIGINVLVESVLETGK